MWQIKKCSSLLPPAREGCLYIWNTTLSRFSRHISSAQAAALGPSSGAASLEQKELIDALDDIKSMRARVSEGVAEVDGKDFMLPVFNAEKEKLRIPSFFESIVRDPVPQENQGGEGNLGREYWERKRKQQLELETRSVYEAIEKYKKDVKSARNREVVASLPRARRLLLIWLPLLQKQIDLEQKKMLEKCSKMNYTPDLLEQNFVLLEPDEMAVVTIHIIMSSLLKYDKKEKQMDYGRMKVAKLSVALGNALQNQLNLLKLKQKVKIENQRRKKLNEYLRFRSGEIDVAPVIELQPWEERMINSAERLDKKIRTLKNRWNHEGVTPKDVIYSRRFLADNYIDWDKDIKLQLGTKLLTLFKEVAMVQLDKKTKKIVFKENKGMGVVTEPVLKHEHQWYRGKSKKQRLYGVISINPAILNDIESCDLSPSMVMGRHVPMVYPPREWKRCDDGGYLSLPSFFMRIKDNPEAVKHLMMAEKERKLDKVFEAVNFLGNTGWKINKEVMKVVDEIWENGGGILDIPSRTDLEIPQSKPYYYKAISRSGALLAMNCGETDYEWHMRREIVKKNKKKNRELHSLRSDFLLKLQVAHLFLNEDKFYFPHNLDFRGRAYPIPPHLNHLGNDVSRGLLLFSDAKPLTERGLEWLYIQIANLYGQGEDKKSIEQRREFGESQLEEIFDSAENPLSGRRWWMKGDSPWQLLATCIEIKNAIKSGNPSTYLSSMHDGSCNGLQHYAALGRDLSGGTAVNLRPDQRPQDLYTGVADIVARRVAEDSKNGHKYAQILDGHVNRKLVKQTVMTSVYGVTFVGARDQIETRLRERGWDNDELLFRVSGYAANVTLDGLHEMFQSAKSIMKWLSDCAREIAKTGKSVSWSTPLGLPVFQPYRKMDVHTVKTVLQTVNLQKYNDSLPVMKQKQKSAFPPNYIHSLDSTHLMLTALGCKEQGLVFAGVHDSFWTHASCVDQMNCIIRETFFELHSRPLLQDLRQQFNKNFSDCEFPEIPPMGKLELSEILKSQYFFN